MIGGEDTRKREGRYKKGEHIREKKKIHEKRRQERKKKKNKIPFLIFSSE